VALQLALMGLAVAAWAAGPRWPSAAAGACAVGGALLGLAGGALAGWAALVLGRSLTPFPRPARAGSLAARGPYALVRHPIYLGGILFFAGLSLALSPLALAPTAALALLWALKLRVEERFLRAAYPEYDAYAERTRYRLLPFVY